jgi:hypothetical protein
MGLVDVGNQQTGLQADTSFTALNGTVNVPVGGFLPIGMPLARIITSGQGNYLSRFAAVTGLGAFASGDTFSSLPLSGAQSGTTTTGAAAAGGVYIGQPQSNPWLSQPAGTLNTAIQSFPAMIARTGARLVLAGALNGGTAIKLGDFLFKGPTLGTTSLTPFLLSGGNTTQTIASVGNIFGQVIATPIWTTVAAATAAGAGVVMTPTGTNGITTATPLTINPGGSTQETVLPTAVTVTAPAVSTLTVAGTAGSAAIAQITFNIAGYQGSVGLTGPTSTATTTFTLLVAIPNGSTATVAAQLIVSAINNSGFGFGAPQNILGIGAGAFTQSGASLGSPLSGPLVYATNAAGVVTFSACNPGVWANTLLTYTITVLNGTTQTFNTSVTGSATAVAFASGANGAITATFQNAHNIGENIIGLANVISATDVGQTIIPIPGTAGMQNCGLVYCDLFTS